MTSAPPPCGAFLCRRQVPTVDVADVDQLMPLLRPPLPGWLAAMSVNTNAARCRPSLGVGVLVAEGSIAPRPAGNHHQRLKVVLAGKSRPRRDGCSCSHNRPGGTTLGVRL